MVLGYLGKYLGSKKWNGNTNVIHKFFNKPKSQKEYQEEFKKKFFEIQDKALKINRYSEYNDIIREEKEIIQRRAAELLVRLQREQEARRRAREAENARWQMYRDYEGTRVSFPFPTKPKQVVDWKRGILVSRYYRDGRERIVRPKSETEMRIIQEYQLYVQERLRKYLENQKQKVNWKLDGF